MASTALIAQYAPKTPKTTLKIAVLLRRKAAKNALTIRTLAFGHPTDWRLQIIKFIRI
jgi:hypothetical protein